MCNACVCVCVCVRVHVRVQMRMKKPEHVPVSSLHLSTAPDLEWMKCLNFQWVAYTMSQKAVITPNYSAVTLMYGRAAAIESQSVFPYTLNAPLTLGSSPPLFKLEVPDDPISTH